MRALLLLIRNNQQHFHPDIFAHFAPLAGIATGRAHPTQTAPERTGAETDGQRLEAAGLIHKPVNHEGIGINCGRAGCWAARCYNGQGASICVMLPAAAALSARESEILGVSSSSPGQRADIRCTTACRSTAGPSPVPIFLRGTHHHGSELAVMGPARYGRPKAGCRARSQFEGANLPGSCFISLGGRAGICRFSGVA